MHPLVKGAAAVAALSLATVAISRTSPSPSTPEAPPPAASSAVGAPAVLTQMPCPPRHLPEGQACVPLPDLGTPLDSAEVPQQERRSRGALFEVIPRKPDRSADPFMFVYPLDDEPLFLRGFDGTVGSEESPVSLELSAERGTPVHAMALEGQEGKTRVVAMGRLIGTTIVTRHEVPGADKPRTYLIVHGHLDATAPDVKVGSELADRDLLGFVGDSGNPGIVSLYLEARVVREDVVIDGMPLDRLLDPASSVPTDARNVLPPR